MFVVVVKWISLREVTNMSIKIEKYTKEHIEAVVNFEKELRLQEPNTYYWDIDEQYINSIKSSFEDSRFTDTAISLLAYQGDRVIGRIDASVVYTHFDGTIYEAYLNWICVLKEERHKGVAQLLLHSLKLVLKEKNIDTLVILTAGNEEATKFYDTCENIEFCRGAMVRI